jgi:prepilin peptidase CpaA
VVLLAFAGLVGWGAISDYSRLIIPNRVSLAVAALYPAHVVASAGAVDWQGATLLAAAAFAIGAVLFALRVIGGGDVKFMSAVVLWVGPALFWPFIVVTTLAGGLLGLALMVGNRYWPTLAVRVIGMASGVESAALPEALHIPYGVAIAAGGLFAAARLAAP